jgi:hypothetical protein
MKPAKIIAKRSDGKILRGYSQDFFPSKPIFHLSKSENGTSQKVEELRMMDLKALFFVKDFLGNPDHEERKVFFEGDKASGRRVEVAFHDGEVLQGSVLGYNPQQPGFFLFPVDPKSNNERVFVINSSVKGFRYL